MLGLIHCHIWLAMQFAIDDALDALSECFNCSGKPLNHAVVVANALDSFECAEVDLNHVESALAALAPISPSDHEQDGKGEASPAASSGDCNDAIIEHVPLPPAEFYNGTLCVVPPMELQGPQPTVAFAVWLSRCVPSEKLDSHAIDIVMKFIEEPAYIANDAAAARDLVESRQGLKRKRRLVAALLLRCEGDAWTRLENSLKVRALDTDGHTLWMHLIVESAAYDGLDIR